MIKVLLVKPSSLLRIDFFKGSGRLQPLNLAYLAAYLRAHHQPAQIYDADCERATINKIIEKIRDSGAGIVGFTACTYDFPDAVRIAKRIKRMAKPPVVVIGGPHVTAIPSSIKNHPCFDFAVIGEGEETLLALVKKIERRENNFEVINGLAFFRGKKFILTPPRPYIKNLDRLPYPARDLMPPLSYYHPNPGMYRQLPMATIITTRGCPYHCIFCCRAVFGNLYRARSPINVVEELELLVKEFGAREIRILDDTFNLDEKRVLEICRQIRKKRLKFSWTFLGRANFVTPRMLKAVKAAGCWEISYGIESGNQKVLNMINKGLTLEVIRKAIRMTREAGLEARGFFMFGLPGETQNSMCQTIDFAKELKLDVANFFMTTPFPGTELLKTASKFGHVNTSQAKHYLYQTTTTPPFVPQGLTASQISYYFHKAYRDFYLRPSYLIPKIFKISSLTQAKRYLTAFYAVLKMGQNY